MTPYIEDVVLLIVLVGVLLCVADEFGWIHWALTCLR